MEKISIARRCWEKHKLPFSHKTDKTNMNMSLSKIDEYPSDNYYPHYSLDSLDSLFKEIAKGVKTGKNQFTVDIVCGLEKPLKMIVSLQLPSSDTANKKFLSVEEAAQVLRIPKKKIYHQLKQGSLRGLKIGRKWRVILNSLNITDDQKEEYRYVLPILGNAEGSL